jgi:hypothetical protein
MKILEAISTLSQETKIKSPFILHSMVSGCEGFEKKEQEDCFLKIAT